MNVRKKLIPYPEERALEDAAYTLGVVPTRIFAILLPVWCVEVRATVTEGEPYELIDRYLERGIADAGLDTAAELARFFALDESLVDRALRFLIAIDHVTESGGRLALTELGRRSVLDQVRYVVTREDRRKMYFDAFSSRPLTRPYYESRTVTLLSGDTLQVALSSHDGPRFQVLCSFRGFYQEALRELARNPNRDHFNLPERIDEPNLLGAPECVYLPLYLIRAIQRDNRVRYLAYTQVGSKADRDVTMLCEQTPEIVGVCENEEHAARSRPDQTWATEWLRKRKLDGRAPVRLADGTLRITLPASSFDTTGPLSITKLGSFVVVGNDFFQVWCGDEQVRRRALLERIDSYLNSRVRIDPADLTERIAQIARQLDLGPIDVSTLHRIAVKAGRRGLAAQLEGII